LKIGIGIDTGGTYTDIVAYDYDTETLLAKGKTLTTRDNLANCIHNALDLLPPVYVSDATIISLSTTLATNACVENKGCRAKLLIFGLTDELMARYGAESKYGIKRDSVRCIDTNGSFDGFNADEPDWSAVETELLPWLSDADALSIAELYSMANGAPCERHAKQLFEERLGLQCVGASELSDELDVVARGATALLNARLFPLVTEFIEAAMSDFAARGCHASVMVVRSDGSLMSAELTRNRPVATILSGPAASVLAGKSFTDSSDYLVVDMGGTTTDVSVVNGGRPAMADDGIHIGGWVTHVKGVFIDTFALGGDSTVRKADGQIKLFSRRAMPVCQAAHRWPEVADMLRELLREQASSKRKSGFPLYEFLYLVREPEDLSRYDSYEQDLISALLDGPCILSLLQSKKGIDLYHLNSERLEAEGVVMRCGLTPTDFMHIRRDYIEYDAEASHLAARYFLRDLGRPDTPEELQALTDEVYDMVEGKLFENLVRVLLKRQYPKRFSGGLDEQTEFLVREAWANKDKTMDEDNDKEKSKDNAKDKNIAVDKGSDKEHHNGKIGESNALFTQLFSTTASLISVGAPTHLFLPHVAKALGTRCVIPEHAEVGGALGALKADISASVRIDITQFLTSEGGMYYVVHTPEGSIKTFKFDDAIEKASAASVAAVINEARARGATGELNVSTTVNKSTTTTSFGSEVKTGSSVTSEVTVRFA